MSRKKQTMFNKIGFLTAVFLFACSICYAQGNPIKIDSLYMIVFRVCDKHTELPLPFSAVYNKSTHEGTFTDTLGLFRIKAKPTDTLKISCLGFIPQMVELSSYNFGHLKTIQIYLNRRLFVLHAVDIKGISWKQFKTQVMNQKGPEVHSKIITLSKEFQRDLVLLCPAGGLGIPSKEDIQRAKLPALEEKSLQDEEIKKKYSKKMIEGLTGLKGDELIRFEDFCNFSHDYLYRTNGYHLIMAVLSKYDEYKQRGKNTKPFINASSD